MITAKEARDISLSSNSFKFVLNSIFAEIKNLSENGEFSYVKSFFYPVYDINVVEAVRQKLQNLGYDAILHRSPKSITLSVNWSNPK
jgi:hypothetical protein